MEKDKEFTIITYIPKDITLLNKILKIFSQKLMIVDSINVSPMETEETNKVVIVSKMKESQLKKIIELIKKQCSIERILYHEENETIYKELALFKISSDLFANKNSLIQSIIDKNRASIIDVTSKFFVVLKTGNSNEILKLYKEIAPLGLIEFNRSGRTALTNFS